jgi:hypothetical protein
MKKTFGILAMVMIAASFGFADTLEVLGSPDITPMEGTYSLVVHHDNTSTAYVVDQTPADESIYRFEFLFNPNDISPGTANWRHTIFWAQSLNTRPGNGTCPTNPAAKIPAYRLFLTLRDGGTLYGVRAVLFGNICGRIGTINVDVPSNSPSKICGYWMQGADSVTQGESGLAVVGATDPCPTFGDAAYETAAIRNNELAIMQVALGSLATNPFGAGENGDLTFDSFASYRTLAP